MIDVERKKALLIDEEEKLQSFVFEIISGHAAGS